MRNVQILHCKLNEALQNLITALLMRPGKFMLAAQVDTVIISCSFSNLRVLWNFPDAAGAGLIQIFEQTHYIDLVVEWESTHFINLRASSMCCDGFISPVFTEQQ